MCMYARQLVCNAPFNFLQEDITQIRRHDYWTTFYKLFVQYISINKTQS